MGYRIKIKEFDADITLPVKDLVAAFACSKSCKIESYSHKGNIGISVINKTEMGWVGIWAKQVEDGKVNIYARGSSSTFYSRNGRWFLDAIETLATLHKGNLLLITREPETGEGRQTIIVEGEMVCGCFSHKVGSPFGFKCIWRSQYDPRKDIDEPIDMKIHDVAEGTTETIRIEPA